MKLNTSNSLAAAFAAGLRFTVDNIVKKPLIFIGLSFLILIPSLGELLNNSADETVNFVVYLVLLAFAFLGTLVLNGVLIKIMRGDRPDFSDIKNTLCQGFIFGLIEAIYRIVLVIVGFICGDFIFVLKTGVADVILSVIHGEFNGYLLVLLVLLLGYYFVLIPALLNYADKGKFDAGFNLCEIYGMIHKAGWGKYIISFVFVMTAGTAVFLLLDLLNNLLSFAPVTGEAVYLVIDSFVYVFFIVVFAKFFARVLVQK